MVADDDPEHLSSIAFMLDALKLEYYLASNGKNALDLVYEKKPNLVLLDVAMPYLNGIEANILIKSDLFTNHISTIAIVEPTAQQIEAIKKAGFDGYVVKPFMIENLKTIIKRFISK